MAESPDLFTRVDETAYGVFHRLTNPEEVCEEDTAREIRGELVAALRRLGTVSESGEERDFDLGPLTGDRERRVVHVIMGKNVAGNALVKAVTETLLRRPPGFLLVEFEHLGAYLSVKREGDGIAAALDDSNGMNGIT